jgi:hypothetical protein
VVAPESGCLCIADISGYTGYLVDSPLEYAEDVVADVTGTISDHLGQVLRVNKREGDAVLAYAADDEVDATMLLDAVEECYFAFRSRLQGIHQATDCTCPACRQATQLDLKFVLHAGEWVRRGDELTGRDVIVAHRLLKNGIGLTGYLLVTEAFATAFAIDPVALGMRPHVESYSDVGEVRGFVSDLESRYRVERERRRILVGEGESAIELEHVVPVPPAAAWAYLTAPGKRVLWQVDEIEEAQEGGRRCTGTASVCVDGRTRIYEEILDWRPFDYFTERRTLPGGARFVLTTSLDPEPGGGTIVRVRGRRDGGRRSGPLAARRLARRLRLDHARLARVVAADEA